VGVDRPRRLDCTARPFLDVGDDAPEVGVGEHGRRGELDVQDASLGGDQRLELGADLPDLPRSPFLDDDEDEVADKLVGTAEDLLEHLGLDARLRLGIHEQSGELGHLVDGGREVLELLADDIEPVPVLRGLEEGASVDALRSGYERLTSSCVKSISASASSMSRFWSASVSDFRVIFSAASSERTATACFSSFSA